MAMTCTGVILRALSHQSEPEVEVCEPESVSFQSPECSHGGSGLDNIQTLPSGGSLDKDRIVKMVKGFQ